MQECGACGQITFLGNLSMVEDVLTGADLFLLPSETESFGLAALEALSCEVPVIATEVGGLPEVVLSGENGYLLPVGDVAAMAEACLELLRDDDLRRRFGAAGRRWAVETFSEQKALALYRETYRRVLDG